ncbi:imidazolonepropionase [Planctomycetes bacterium Poly30]|uniref:Imidazolonepropionase n=1 Tax=Saltatorellus ferox TaxID=2528018 RepID=A0A518EQL0_9BACT|nr:imidazolonepropionase [Planctomycetes bacterium Poly30]
MTLPRLFGSAALTLASLLSGGLVSNASAQVAIRGDVIHTGDGGRLQNGVLVIEDGKISAMGPAADIVIPGGFEVLSAAVVTPGLVDVRSVVGLAGAYAIEGKDQDQVEEGSAIQPELRALDAYNPRDELVAWVRGFGVTTVQTGHAPEELVPGQLFIVKTRGVSADADAVKTVSGVAATIGEAAVRSGKDSPGTRGKMMALLRAKLIEGQAYVESQNRASADEDKDAPKRDLALDAIAAVLRGELPLVVTAHRAQDIASALRLADEFKVQLVLDGASESYLMLDEIKASGFPVSLHATMKRSVGEAENLSFQTAAKLHEASIPFAIQSGYEAYVPKTRVVLFEAAVAASHGLGFDAALASITSGAARILGLQDRVGTLAVGMDGDVALFDGDPFEYTTHCVGTVIEGVVVARGERQR